MSPVEQKGLNGMTALESNHQPRPGPGRKTSHNPTWVRVADGVWRNVKLKKKKTLFERPKINGAATFRSLHTDQVRLAKEELARRKTLRLYGIESTQNRLDCPHSALRLVTETPSSAGRSRDVATMGSIIRYYQQSDHPDRYKQQRPERTRRDETRHCSLLLEFWDHIPIENCGPAACDRYHTWRIETRKCRNVRGNRTVDRELNTLNNACKWALRNEIIRRNPIADRPNYDRTSDVQHCREFMPRSVDELHEGAALLFASASSVVLGFQMIAQAYTGLRTEEILKWGTQDFGSLTPDGEYVNVWRCKNQHAVNPYCRNHAGLKALFAAHAEWKRLNYPESPHFFPSSRTGCAISKTALARALKRFAPRMKRRLRPHGAGRAFYVLTRRSQGAKDEVIAYELGHQSNGACIRSTYGGVPLEWQTGEPPNLGWLPSKAPIAWARLQANGWTFSRSKIPQGANGLLFD